MANFNKGHDTGLVFPFTAETLKSLGPTNLVSPTIGNNHGYTDPVKDLNAEMEDVERVRYEVDKNIYPSWFMEKNGVAPELSPILTETLRLSERFPKACAKVVRMDHPFDIWDEVIQPWAQSQNIGWNDPPEHQGVPFIETLENEARAHAMIINGLRKSFEVKYWFGAQRPFEYSDYGQQLEMYPCPAHPEKPAGHGAFCGAGAKAFEVIYGATDGQVQMVHTATKQFAMFRSFSAMHIASSNLLGWRIGYEA